MKKLIVAIVVITCLPAHADKAADLYKQGMTAVSEGNAKAADTAFREVLRLQPGHANARYQLAELKRSPGTLAARARAKKLGEYTIEQVDFSKSELSEALAALSMMVEKKSEGKFSPNFMIQDPSNKFADQTVSLQVKNVPANAVLDMLLRQVGGAAKFDEHAIVIKPGAKSGE